MNSLVAVLVVVLASACIGLSSSNSSLDEGLVPCDHLCPLWAKQMNCEHIYTKDKSLPFRNRRLRPDCPLSCQACSVEDGDDIDEIVAQYNIHCLDIQVPETQDVWKPGDANRMYERILSEFGNTRYQPTVLSRDPWIIQLENVATPQEARVMVEQTRLEVAKGEAEAIPEAENDESGVCHSTQAWCEDQSCLQQPEIQSVIQKVESLVDMPFTYAEPIHLIEYIPGQKYGRQV